jgi:hypothetical protein
VHQSCVRTKLSTVFYDLSATITAFKSWIPRRAFLRFKYRSTASPRRNEVLSLDGNQDLRLSVPPVGFNCSSSAARTASCFALLATAPTLPAISENLSEAISGVIPCCLASIIAPSVTRCATALALSKVSFPVSLTCWTSRSELLYEPNVRQTFRYSWVAKP